MFNKIAIPEPYKVMPDSLRLDSKDMMQIYGCKNYSSFLKAMYRGDTIQPCDTQCRVRLKPKLIWTLGQVREAFKEQENQNA